MASNTVEIDVELNGLDKASKNIKLVEKQMVDLDQAGTAVGESFNNAGSAIANMGGTANEALGPAVGSIGNMVGALGDLKGAAVTTGGSFTAMLGPIGLVLVAVVEAAKAFKEYSDQVDGTTMKMEAYTAAAAEAKSMVEGLADAGVELTRLELKQIRQVTNEAQRALEMGQKVSEKAVETQVKLEKAEANLARLRLESASKELDVRSTHFQQMQNMRDQQIDHVAKQIESYRIKLDQLYKESDDSMEKGAETRKKSAELRLNLEKRSTDAVKERLKLQFELEQKLMIMRTERLGGKVGQATLAQETVTRLKELQQQYKDQQITEEQFFAMSREINLQHSRQLQKLNDEENKKRQAQRKAVNDKRQADALKLQAELNQIEIQRILMTKEGLEQEDALIDQSYKYRTQLAKDNTNLQTIAFNQYVIELEKLDTKREALELQAFNKREARDKAEEQKQRRLLNEQDQRSIELLQMKEQTIDREIALINLRYGIEARLAEENQTKLDHIEAKRMHSIKKVQKQTELQMKEFMPTIDAFGRGLAQSAVAAAMFGESFSASVGAVLKSLSMEAGVKALMETAYGVAASLLNPAMSAKHFQAAGIFASASVVAKGASMALGTSGASGGGGASPSTAPPLREDADSSRSIVYNINFGGTVYDTKKAAQIAFSDAVTRQQARSRRGSPRAI